MKHGANECIACGMPNCACTFCGARCDGTEAYLGDYFRCPECGFEPPEREPEDPPEYEECPDADDYLMEVF